MVQQFGAFISPLPLLARPVHAPLQPCIPRRALSCRTRRSHALRTSWLMSSTKPPETPEDAKSVSNRQEASRYWQGDWICVDCGYTYKPGRKIKFEDLPASWKCPQCNAPKRRFAKKAGDYIAETAGTSNLPILLFSLVGLLATVLFGIWASYNL